MHGLARVRRPRIKLREIPVAFAEFCIQRFKRIGRQRSFHRRPQQPTGYSRLMSEQHGNARFSARPIACGRSAKGITRARVTGSLEPTFYCRAQGAAVMLVSRFASPTYDAF